MLGKEFDLSDNSKVIKTEDIINCDSGSQDLCKAREFSISLVDHGELLVHIWKLDGTLIKFNNCAQVKTGYSEDQVIGNGWINTIIPESDVQALLEMFTSVREGYVPSTVECKLYCKYGRALDIMWSNYIMRDTSHNPYLAVSVGMDITELRQVHGSLLKSDERYKLALEGSNDGIWDFDIEDNNRFFYSDRCIEMLGYTRDEINNKFKSWRELIHPEDYSRFDMHLKDYLNKNISVYNIEFRMRKKSGDYIWMLSKGKAIWDENNKPIRIAGSHTNIQDRKTAEEIMYKLAYYDELTGLPNRAMLWKQLSIEVEKAKSSNFKIALLSMDIDDFKNINDTLGHNTGDELLKIIAARVNKLASDNITVSRCGGDEFLVLIRHIENEQDVIDVCNRLLKEFEEPIRINNVKIHITTSIGASIFPNNGQDQYTLLKNTDIAMYSAKDEEGNNFKLFSSEMNIRVLERLELENGLRGALKNNEFCVYYQPQICIENNEVVGLEALIRWQHPVKGLIPPLKFIPLAEDSGLIIPIGEWIFRKVCQQFVEWKKNNIEPKRIAVNISAKQFEQNNFVSTVRNIISETGIDPRYLELEITESIAMKNLDYTLKVINELKELEIKVSLDDFGTGYSSLNYLMRLPINTLKLDKSFLDNIKQHSNEELIAKTIIALAKKMNLDVIAEGVETLEQLKFLKEQSCDIAQGYLFSKPVPTKEASETLARKKIII